MFQQIYEMLVSVKKSEHILLKNLSLPDLPKGRNFPRTRLYCLCSAFPSKNDFYSRGRGGGDVAVRLAN